MLNPALTASVGILYPLALIAKNPAHSSELLPYNKSSHTSSACHSDEFEEIFSASDQLFGQSVKLTPNEAIHASLTDNPQAHQEITLVQEKKSRLTEEKRKQSPTLNLSRTSQDPILGKRFLTLIATNDNYKNVEPDNFTTTNIVSIAARIQWNLLDLAKTPSIKRLASLLESQESLLIILCKNLTLETQRIYGRPSENHKFMTTCSSICENNEHALRTMAGQTILMD